MTSRLLLSAITVLTVNCGVAVAGPNQTSADYVMPGCREAASLITFSNAAESEEQVSLMSFCAGIVVGISFVGQPYGICARGARLLNKPLVSSFSTSSGGL